MKKILESLQKVENALIIISFSIMVLASFSQVVNRNIFMLGIGWFEEIAVYCMIWMTLLGTELGLRDGTQISVTAMVDRLGKRGQQIAHIFSKLLVVAFSAAITNSAIGMVMKQIQTGQTSPGLKIPMAIPYASLLIGFGIMTLVQGITLILMIIRLFKPDSERGEEA